jgi:hypothetical protein
MSTNTTRSAKLYSGLTPAQLARIAHGYIAKQDRAELQRIVEALPVYTYRAPSREYFRAVEVTHQIALQAGLIYWRASAQIMAAHGLCLQAESHEPAKLRAAIERLENKEGELNAIIAAWQELCERMGWDIAALSQTAQIPLSPPPAKYDEVTKAEHLAGWQSVLDAAGMVAA